MTTNLLSLDLDFETYFDIYEVLIRHRREDIDDFVADIIMALGHKTIKQEINELKNTVYRVEADCDTALDAASSAEVDAKEAKERVDQALEKLDDTELFIYLKNQASKHENAKHRFIDDVNVKMIRLSGHLNDIVQGLREVMDFITTDKTINLRNKKAYNNKTILNLRKKLEQVEKITTEIRASTVKTGNE